MASLPVTDSPAAQGLLSHVAHEPQLPTPKPGPATDPLWALSPLMSPSLWYPSIILHGPGRRQEREEARLMQDEMSSLFPRRWCQARPRPHFDLLTSYDLDIYPIRCYKIIPKDVCESDWCPWW